MGTLGLCTSQQVVTPLWGQPTCSPSFIPYWCPVESSLLLVIKIILPVGTAMFLTSLVSQGYCPLPGHNLSGTP